MVGSKNILDGLVWIDSERELRQSCFSWGLLSFNSVSAARVINGVFSLVLGQLGFRHSHRAMAVCDRVALGRQT